ncbi:MAG: hypothetical protein IKN77_02140 [Paludibacteraceae bacterium]|nr:hypothetical protein [Paludibacteraceae bacterium]
MEESKNDKVSVRFYWDNPMTIDQMSNFVYDFLVDFETISPVLKGWCNLGKRRKDALSRKFENSPTYIKKLLLRFYKRDMDEREYSNIGYTIYLYKDREEKPMNLEISSNDLEGYFTALCIFEYVATDLFDTDTLLSILRCMLKHFEPDYGCVQTYNLRKMKDEIGNYFGWISYTHKKDLKLGDEFIVEKDETGGSLIYLNHTEKFYDYDKVNQIFALGEILTK